MAKHLNRRHRARLAVPEYGDPRSPGSRALVVEAANTVLPEAAVDDLPRLARAELASGLSGRLRQSIASCEEDDPRLPGLRDELVAHLGGSADGVGAITVTDRVYLGRLQQDIVPPVIAAACVGWYGRWRASSGGPSMGMAAAMSHLLRLWEDRPSQRDQVDERIAALVDGHIDRMAAGLIDASV